MLAQRHLELAFPDLHGSSLTASESALVIVVVVVVVVVVGLFRLERHNWGLASTTACECDAKEDTAEHITPCLIYHHPNEFRATPNVSRARRPG